MGQYTVYKCAEILPIPGRYVLVHYCGGNWHDNFDQSQGFNWQVAALRVNDWDMTNAKNKIPYKFDTFGSMSMDPESVDMWAELPTLPQK